MEIIEQAWHVTQCIRVHALPQCIMERQLQALRRKYKHDTMCIERCRRIHVCLYCCVKRQGGGLHHSAKMRHDCETGKLVCVSCNIPCILEVDILGRIAQVGEHWVLLSSCCATLMCYTGNGREFSTACCPDCDGKNLLYPPKGRAMMKTNSHNHFTTMMMTAPCAPIAGAAGAANCAVCHQRNVAQTFEVLSVKGRRMQCAGLCQRHLLHRDILRTVNDEEELERALQLNARPSSFLPQGGCGGGRGGKR